MFRLHKLPIMFRILFLEMPLPQALPVLIAVDGCVCTANAIGATDRIATAAVAADNQFHQFGVVVFEQQPIDVQCLRRQRRR